MFSWLRHLIPESEGIFGNDCGGKTYELKGDLSNFIVDTPEIDGSYNGLISVGSVVCFVQLNVRQGRAEYTSDPFHFWFGRSKIRDGKLLISFYNSVVEKFPCKTMGVHWMTCCADLHIYTNQSDVVFHLLARNLNLQASLNNAQTELDILRELVDRPNAFGARFGYNEIQKTLG